MSLHDSGTVALLYRRAATLLPLSILVVLAACSDAPMQPEAEAGDPSYARTAAPVVVTPADGAWLTGVQRFTAKLDGMATRQYTMTYAVDGRPAVSMPAKNSTYMEARVDVSGWTWKGTGPYAVVFTATDRKGRLLGRTMVNVNVGTPTLAVVNVEVAPAAVSIVAGGTTQLAATAKDDSGNAMTGVALSWSSSNAAIASVDANGVVTGVSAGTAVVTASGGGKSGTATVTVQAVTTPPPAPTQPFSGAMFYIDPNSKARQTADAWRSTRPADAAQMDKVANSSWASWYNGWHSDVRSAVNSRVTTVTNAGALPVLVAYNIPQRDCGSYSAGGSESAEAYRAWIQAFADGIGSRRAVVILEPDALAGMGCLSATDQDRRVALLLHALRTLKAKGNVAVYLDAGHPKWLTTATAASRLQRAGIAEADGFALNVSNFHTTADNVRYGETLSALVGGKHFVIDTSRNGMGSNGEWCNPSGRALGARATSATGHALVDALLWIKVPGESDGTCNGGPNSGAWWPEYALGLAQRSTLTGSLMAAAD